MLQLKIMQLNCKSISVIAKYFRESNYSKRRKRKTRVGKEQRKRNKYLENKGISREKLRYADKLRKRMTKAEVAIWPYLSKQGWDAQEVVWGFIPDFYHPEYNLAIEVDGSIHDIEEIKQRDQLKERILKNHGVKIIRLTNAEVLANPESIAKDIAHRYLGKVRKRKIDSITASMSKKEERGKALQLRTERSQKAEAKRKSSFIKRIRVIKKTDP